MYLGHDMTLMHTSVIAFNMLSFYLSLTSSLFLSLSLSLSLLSLPVDIVFLHLSLSYSLLYRRFPYYFFFTLVLLSNSLSA